MSFSITQADRLFERVQTPQDLALDGRALRTISHFCVKGVAELSANAVDFRADTFADKLCAKIGGEQGTGASVAHWGMLGKRR